jgi:hypothetical protein
LLARRSVLLPLLLSACGSALAASQPAEVPFSGTLEVGLVREKSQFNVVHIDEAALLLSEGSTRSTETFRHIAASGSATTPCGGVVHCTANASLDTRTGHRTREADTGTAMADIGLQWRLPSTTVGARGLIEQWQVVGKTFRRVQGLAADAAVAVDERVSAYALLNLSTYRHPGDGAALDSRYQALTGNLRVGNEGGWQTAWTAQVTASREQNRQHERALDNHGLMLRLAWEAKPADTWELRASVLAQWLQFAALDQVLLVKRADRYTGLDLALVRVFSDELQIRLEWNRSLFRSSARSFDNDSDSFGLKLALSF